jgi:ribonucleotide reductase alpha subunit
METPEELFQRAARSIAKAEERFDHSKAASKWEEAFLLQRYGSLATIPDVPPSAKDLFRTALEITPEDHLRMQVAFQKHVNNAVSKTINMPQTATPEDIAAIYRQAWEWGAQGHYNVSLW